MVILGIDPGTATTGFGVIKKENNNLSLIAYGCIYTDKKLPAAMRLQEIKEAITQLVKKYNPKKVAVEDLFFFKNLKTAMAVSQSRGVILCELACYKLSIVEFTPLQVKQAVTGYGRAEKIQVQKMVKAILNLKEIPKPNDAADALAIAICCAHYKQYD
jgi:crossover junction endodeoxyribonuclease RuvC